MSAGVLSSSAGDGSTARQGVSTDMAMRKYVTEMYENVKNQTHYFVH